jgi:hypothetical protein
MIRALIASSSFVALAIMFVLWVYEEVDRFIKMRRIQKLEIKERER